jgi:putative phosphoesterase
MTWALPPNDATQMRLAVLSDIHGNADALAAVLADVAWFAPDAIVNLGDCFSGPLDAGRTADMLEGAGIAATVRGNCDRYLCDPATMERWDQVAYPQLSARTRAWLSTLPVTAVIDDVFLCHATPLDDETAWLDEHTTAGPTMRRTLDWITGHATDIRQSIMLCGHTHTPRLVRLVDGRLIVNPGSVGCPGYMGGAGDSRQPISTGTPFAAYAMIDRAGGTWSVTQHHIPYDTAPAISLARAAGFDDWVRVLETGWL